MTSQTVFHPITNLFRQLCRLFSAYPQLAITHQQLPQWLPNAVMTPVGDVLPLLTAHATSRVDTVLDLKLVSNLLEALQQRAALVRLNHIGFCYQVRDLDLEQQRLIESCWQANTALYLEPSDAVERWLFIGNLDDWLNPVIECIPVAETSDPEASYWLPHIQLDCDTTLSAVELMALLKRTLGKEVVVFPILINGTPYIVRTRLGSAGGVNIFLDLATSARQVRTLRHTIWQRVA